MAGEQQQPISQGMSAAQIAQINAQSQQATSSNAKASDFDSLLNSIIGQSGGVGTFFKAKLDSLFSTGIFAQFTPQQGWAEKQMNQGAQSLTARGGRLGEGFALLKPDFSGISAPPIQGVEIGSMMDMSFASLGSLTPSFGGGGMDMGGMGIS